MNNILLIISILCILLLIHVYTKNTMNITIDKSNDLHFITSNNFLSSSMCNDIINMSEKKTFKQSRVTKIEGSTKDYNREINNVRTSETIVYNIGSNEIIDNIVDRLSDITGIDKSHFEPVQITRYSKGQEFKYHYDYFAKTDNQRIKTCLIYLNDVPDNAGGYTHFYHLDKYIKPECGKCVIWNNVINGTPIIQSLHAGLPIIKDCHKYIMTIWIREHSYINK